MEITIAYLDLSLKRYKYM